MTARDRFDDTVATWLLESGPADIRGRAVDEAIATAARRPQYVGLRGWLTGPSPWPGVGTLSLRRLSPPMRVALIVALIVASLVGVAAGASRLLLSPDTAPLPAPATGVFEPTGDLAIEVGLSLTLPQRNGSVLIADGLGLQRYDPAAGAFASLGETDYQIRGWAEAANGDLLVVHIEEEPSEPPTGRSWVVVERLAPGGATGTSVEIGRSDFFYLQSAVALQDGRIAILGQDFGVAALVALIFDPETRTFSRSGSTPLIVNGEHATPLPDGRILVIDQPTDCVTMNVAIFDAPARSFASLGSLPCASWFSTTVLRDGRVLIAGGGTPSSNRFVELSNAAYLIDPGTGTVTPVGPMPEARWMHAAALAADGRVLIAGGNLQLASDATPAMSTLLFNPATLRFVVGPNMLNGRMNATAVTLSDRRILIFGHTPLVQGGAVGPGPVAEIFGSGAK